LGVVLLTGQWAYILGGISLSIIKQKNYTPSVLNYKTF
jgi:hypothetical protein